MLGRSSVDQSGARRYAAEVWGVAGGRKGARTRTGVALGLAVAVLALTGATAVAQQAGWLSGSLEWLHSSGLWGRFGLSAIFGEPDPGDTEPLSVAVHQLLAEVDVFLLELDQTFAAFDDVSDADLELAARDPLNPLRTQRLVREIRENRNLIPALASEVRDTAARLSGRVKGLRSGEGGTGGSAVNQRLLDDTFYRARLSRWHLRDTLDDVTAQVDLMREEIRVQNWRGAVQRLETVAAIQAARIEELGYLHRHLVTLESLLPYSRQNRSSSVVLP